MTLEIAGKVQKRFVQDAVLLHKLDPVRGSPTTYGLDRHPHDADGSREVLLKRKFLDSIALLASTHKNADRVSAATLEIGAPEGTVVRIASNAGVCDTTLILLRDLISDLHDMSNRGKIILLPRRRKLMCWSGLTTERRIDVLMKIIRIDVEKIRYYFEKLHRVQSEVPDIMNTLLLLSSEPAFADAQQFSAWMENLSAVTAVATGASAVQLLPHILWAEKAKWEYSTYIEAIFSAQGSQLPWWIYHIYKLGRYAVASRALCQLPAEYPGLFCPMRIEPIHSPPRLDFSIPPHERPLSEVLRRIIGDREDEIATRLASVWGATNPESYFRKASHLRLAVHAEMQLVGFYDQHPELIPSFRFIGVSKKSCFLCQKFLHVHPASFSVSSSHQKLYLAWRSPPASNSKLHKTYKSIITNLCTSMETMARQELQYRTGSARNIQLDSTAGVSISGLVDYRPVSPLETAIDQHASSSPESTMDNETPAGAPLRTDDDLSATARGRTFSTSSLPDCNCHQPPAFVFNVVRADDSQRRDVVSSDDILNSSQEPSWQMLVDLLSSDDQFGVRFNQEREFFVVNDALWVRNERQFHACTQFLRNSSCCNAEVQVRTYASISSDVT